MMSSSFSVASQRALETIIGPTRLKLASRMDQSIGGIAMPSTTRAMMASISVKPRRGDVGFWILDFGLEPVAPDAVSDVALRAILNPKCNIQNRFSRAIII